jgi:alpha-ribazole phosphatase
LCYGQLDLPAELDSNDVVRLEAALANGERESKASYEAIWSSPARRCLPLAKALAAARSLEVQVDARLWELSFGTWEGRRFAQLEQEPIFFEWMNDWQRRSPPGGESLMELQQRVFAWLQPFRARQQAAALLVTHAGVIRALRVELAGWDWKSAMAHPVEHLVPIHFEV